VRTALLALAVCLAGCASPGAHLRGVEGPDLVVQLRSATLPGALQPVACHCFWVTYDPAKNEWHRWEVLQEPHQCETSWGYVHFDAFRPDTTVGGGPVRVEREWRGDDARRLAAALATSPSYPARDVYRAWPGPNSNTFAAWVLRQSGVSAEMPPTAVGKDYVPAVAAGRTTSGTGVQFETLPLGAKVGLKEGVEANVLGMTIGVSLWPPAIKLPFGRIGPRN